MPSRAARRRPAGFHVPSLAAGGLVIVVPGHSGCWFHRGEFPTRKSRDVRRHSQIPGERTNSVRHHSGLPQEFGRHGQLPSPERRDRRSRAEVTASGRRGIPTFPQRPPHRAVRPTAILCRTSNADETTPAAANNAASRRHPFGRARTLSHRSRTPA